MLSFKLIPPYDNLIAVIYDASVPVRVSISKFTNPNILQSDGTLFTLSKWDDYSYRADSHIESFKSNLPQNEPYYTPKKRRLFE
jgi:hypothetical protein